MSAAPQMTSAKQKLIHQCEQAVREEVPAAGESAAPEGSPRPMGLGIADVAPFATRAVLSVLAATYGPAARALLRANAAEIHGMLAPDEWATLRELLEIVAE